MLNVHYPGLTITFKAAHHYAVACPTSSIYLTKNRLLLVPKPIPTELKFRNLQTTQFLLDSDPLKPSSKVEESVLSFKETLKNETFL